MVSSSVAGICVIRDAADLAPFLCGHYLRAGFAHIAFVDDGSSDGTFQILKRISERTARVPDGVFRGRFPAGAAEPFGGM